MNIHSLQLTCSHLKMEGWNISFLLGWPIFRGELLVSGRVPSSKHHEGLEIPSLSQYQSTHLHFEIFQLLEYGELKLPLLLSPNFAGTIAEQPKLGNFRPWESCLGACPVWIKMHPGIFTELLLKCFISASL